MRQRPAQPSPGDDPSTRRRQSADAAADLAEDPRPRITSTPNTRASRDGPARTTNTDADNHRRSAGRSATKPTSTKISRDDTLTKRRTRASRYPPGCRQERQARRADTPPGCRQERQNRRTDPPPGCRQERRNRKTDRPSECQKDAQAWRSDDTNRRTNHDARREVNPRRHPEPEPPAQNAQRRGALPEHQGRAAIDEAGHDERRAKRAETVDNAREDPSLERATSTPMTAQAHATLTWTVVARTTEQDRPAAAAQRTTEASKPTATPADVMNDSYARATDPERSSRTNGQEPCT